MHAPPDRGLFSKRTPVEHAADHATRRSSKMTIER